MIKTEYYKTLKNGTELVRTYSTLGMYIERDGVQYGEAVDDASFAYTYTETHSGEPEDPIPYNGNMTLEQGKHYILDDEIYICTRSTGNPVYHTLADLIGLYVEIA